MTSLHPPAELVDFADRDDLATVLGSEARADAVIAAGWRPPAYRMSTTTGADTALDLDAIEARAKAATPAPWQTDQSELSHPRGWDISAEASKYGYIASDGEGYQGAVAEEADAEFVAHARTDIPVLVAEIRRLRPRVISGDVEAVTAALDGLPVGSIITCEGADEVVGGVSYHLRKFTGGIPRWYESGWDASVSSVHIARHQVPITVLREGTGA